MAGAPGLGYVGVVVSNARNHGLPPALLIAEPGQSATASVVISQTAAIDLLLPADAYAAPITAEDVFFLAYLNWQRPAANVHAITDGLHYLNRGFTLQAYVSQRARPDAVLVRPLRVTLRYAETELGGLDEDQLTLCRWDADRGLWTDTGITVVERDSVGNRFGVTLVQPGEYAFFSTARSGVGKTIYLPLIAQVTPDPVAGVGEVHVYLPLILRQWQESASSDDGVEANSTSS